MSNTANLARAHESRIAREEKSGRADVHIPPGKGTRSLWVLGELLTYKVPSQQTGGAYALFEVTTQHGAGPPPHVQHREDESFYLVEGEYEFLVGGETLRVGAGSLLYVPKGTLHTHRSVGEGVGRMLVTQTPGGLYERFFEEVGKPADGGGQLAFGEQQPEAKGIVKIAAEHGIEIPLPVAQHGPA